MGGSTACPDSPFDPGGQPAAITRGRGSAVVIMVEQDLPDPTGDIGHETVVVSADGKSADWFRPEAKAMSGSFAKPHRCLVVVRVAASADSDGALLDQGDRRHLASAEEGDGFGLRPVPAVA